MSELQMEFRSTPAVCLLDCFLTYETFPQTLTSLAEFTQLDQRTVDRHVCELVDLGIVETIDATFPQEYRLDIDHPAAEKLVDAHTELHNYVREIHSRSDEHDGLAIVCLLLLLGCQVSEQQEFVFLDG